MANIELKSNISSVTIYGDRAMVTRHGRIELDRTADIVIPDLSGALDDQTVRVRAKDLKVGEIQVKTGYAKTLTPAVKKIEDKIKNLRIEDRDLADEITVLHDKQKFLGAVTITSPNIISKEIFMGKLAPDAWRQALQFVGSESVDIKKRIAEIELKRQDIKEKVDALNNEMNDIVEVSQNSKSIIFDVHPEKAQAYELDISYILYGTSWRTYYELRSNASAAKIDLSYFGKISQRTGEDWEDTSIILSTALDTIAPGDTATLSFGVDDRVKVERKLKKSDVTKGGLVKKATRYEYCYENTIKNFHKKEIKCKVFDQIPIAQHPDIKVTNVSIEPKPTGEKEAELGIYEWVIPIAPEKEAKITIAFTVETPVDSTIEGL